MPDDQPHDIVAWERHLTHFWNTMREHYSIDSNYNVAFFDWDAIAAEVGMMNGLQAAQYWILLLQVEVADTYRKWQERRHNGSA